MLAVVLTTKYRSCAVTIPKYYIYVINGKTGRKVNLDEILEYKNIEITLFLAGISGPWISQDIENLNVNGVDTLIIFGNCGVLDKNIEDCSIDIIVVKFKVFIVFFLLS